MSGAVVKLAVAPIVGLEGAQKERGKERGGARNATIMTITRVSLLTLNVS